jgi:UDPglucose 6-dehydrogenase
VRAPSPRNWRRAARPKLPFAVVSNPEFLKEGAAVEDFMRPDRIVVGADDEQRIRPADARAVRALHAQPRPLIVMDVRSAEFTKYAANAMLATRISFMNELACWPRSWAPTSSRCARASAPTRASATTSSTPAAATAALLPKDVKALCAPRRPAGQRLRVLKAVEPSTSARSMVLVDKIVARFGDDLRGPPSRCGAWPSSPTPTTCARRPAAS